MGVRMLLRTPMRSVRPNPSADRTSPGKSGAASNVRPWPAQESHDYFV